MAGDGDEYLALHVLMGRTKRVAYDEDEENMNEKRNKYTH